MFLHGCCRKDLLAVSAWTLGEKEERLTIYSFEKSFSAVAVSSNGVVLGDLWLVFSDAIKDGASDILNEDGIYWK